MPGRKATGGEMQLSPMLLSSDAYSQNREDAMDGKNWVWASYRLVSFMYLGQSWPEGLSLEFRLKCGFWTHQMLRYRAMLYWVVTGPHIRGFDEITDVRSTDIYNPPICSLAYMHNAYIYMKQLLYTHQYNETFLHR